MPRSSPWRFTTLHFTHRRQQGGGNRPSGEAVEAWLDRRAHRVTVSSADGIEVVQGAPYGGTASLTAWGDGDTRNPTSPVARAEAVLRLDGLVAERPHGWHYDHGDPMWRDYQWTAMLDPTELSQGVDIPTSQPPHSAVA